MENKVKVINEFQEKLIGIETTPLIRKDKYPTVILVHGFGVTKEEGGMFDKLAEELVKKDFLVYRFDFSGCGESQGDYSETSLSKLKSDLSKILEFVKLQPKVNASRIGILGQSFGTATTITLKPKVKCLIMMGSVAHPKEALIELFRRGYNQDNISIRIKPNGIIIKIKSQFWKDFENHNLLESIKNIHSPILFIHGEKDDKVPLSEMEAYFKNANEPKEKIIIKGADHGLRPHRNKMHKAVIDWFKKYL